MTIGLSSFECHHSSDGCLSGMCSRTPCLTTTSGYAYSSACPHVRSFSTWGGSMGRRRRNCSSQLLKTRASHAKRELLYTELGKYTCSAKEFRLVVSCYCCCPFSSQYPGE